MIQKQPGMATLIGLAVRDASRFPDTCGTALQRSIQHPDTEGTTTVEEIAPVARFVDFGSGMP
jgi:hypothetical protein